MKITFVVSHNNKVSLVQHDTENKRFDPETEWENYMELRPEQVTRIKKDLGAYTEEWVNPYDKPSLVGVIYGAVQWLHTLPDYSWNYAPHTRRKEEKNA